jgi:hypothetical protein
MNTTRVAKDVSRNKYSDEGISTYAQSINPTFHAQVQKCSIIGKHNGILSKITVHLHPVEL